MLLFVGLGNPGEKYKKTPHNAGFRAMDALRHSLGYSNAYDVGDWDFDKYTESFICIGKTDASPKFVLAKPNTFMNESGKSVKKLIEKFNIKLESNFVLFYDDLDIRLGNFKIVRGKAPKGHKGLKSVFHHLKVLDFWTVRIGIDNRENSNMLGEEYVLRSFSEQELETLENTILQSIKKLRFSITL